MSAPFQRHRNILDFALASLRRRRGRNLALLGAFTLVVFVLASAVFLVEALKGEARLLLAEGPDMVIQRMVAGRHDLIPEGRAASLREIRGVASVKPRLWGYYYDPLFGGNLTVMAVEEGIPEGAMQIGQGVARNLRVGEGDLVSLQSYTGAPQLMAVQSVLPATSELVSSDLVLMHPTDVRSLFALPEGAATDLVLEAGNPRELATIAAKVVERFPDARPILKSEILRTYEAVFDWRGGLLLVVLLGAVLAFALLAWDKATGLSAEERREIGILKALGWESADVLALKFWEGTILSLTAFLAGTLLAYAHVLFFSASLFEQVLKGWSVLFPRFRLAPALDPYQLAVLFCFTVLPYVVATLVPSWRAATVDPDSAVRSS